MKTETIGKDQYDTPSWEDAGRVHDWRNHIGETVKQIWHTFTSEQKSALANDAQDRADREEWE